MPPPRPLPEAAHRVMGPAGHAGDSRFALTSRGAAALAFGAGAMTTLGFAPFGLWWLGFLAYPALALLIDGAVRTTAGRRPRMVRAARLGWAFGFGQFVTGLYWIGYAFFVEADKFALLVPLAVVGLPAFLALFTAAAAAAYAALWRAGPERIVVLALALFAAEWLRGHVLTGFPWNSAGQAIAENAAIAQLASIIGAEGLGLVALLAFAAPAALRGPGRRTARYALPAVAASVLAGGIVWGSVRLAAPVAAVDGVRLRIVQPNVAQADKWRPQLRAAHLDRLFDLSRQGADGAATGITHLIWPESALAFLFVANGRILDEGVASRLADLVPEGGRLVLGAERADASRRASDGKLAIDRVFNTLFVLDDAARLEASYDKIRLVPFGEYLPGGAVLARLGLLPFTHASGSFSRGAQRDSIAVGAAGRWLPLICYEVIFPALAHRAERPDAIVTLTNDAWFGTHSTGPHQHLAQARLRAIEQGLPVVRAANTGISAVIDGYGRAVATLSLGVQGRLDAELPPPLAAPPYARHPALALLVTIAMVAALGTGLAVSSPRRMHE